MLNELVKKRILEQHQRMNAEGKLLTQPQLEQYYATFRTRFGPEQLANLDGESLLETMHAHGNKDSLVYWLEFKNDDEFPSPRFGSISGGSAFKFGVFRRKETGTWVTTDDHNNPVDISVDEAVGIAQKHREQLLRGIDCLRQLPPNGSDKDYRRLQKEMDQRAADVSDLAWGHKYFSLLFPDKLDDLHTVEWQRYLLFKMLQKPPEEKGRYLCAGRFIAAATELGFPVNALTTVLGAAYGWRHRYWRIGTTSGNGKKSYWEMMRDRNLVAIGWSQVGDISWLEAKRESREKVRKLLERAYPDHNPSTIGRDCSQLIHFVADINEGDVVLAANGMTVLGIGRVTGGYEYHPEFGFPHQRSVEWLNVEEWQMPEPKEGLLSSVREIRKHDENILAIEKRIQNSPSAPSSTGSSQTTSQGRVPRLPGLPGRIQSVLNRKSQVILYGPPGTGKTYWAERAACTLASWWEFGKGFEDLTDEERQTITGTGQTSGFVRLCCFHPAYGYEDFIEGYRPESLDGHMVFALRDGVFKQICRDAEKAPDQRFFLIVDEINRGDIPRIFGELLTVLERDKRRKSIILPVSREIFRVPENVFLIGTMNTADRSISLLDAALRRRFGFVELMPDSSVLRDHIIADIPLGAWFDALNRRICEHVGRDARNLQIGHSYLLSDGRPVKDLTALKRAVRDEIIPLLEEYCYEDFSALQNILGSGLLDTENQRIRHDLFEEGHEEALIQALKEPCPEIFTTAEAIVAESGIDEESSDEEDEGP